jgi:hypothetical protein
MERTITYFETPGAQNTEAALRLARRRAEELGIRRIVVASTHGATARRAAEVFRGSGIELTAVSISAAFAEEGWVLTDAERRAMEQDGVRVLTGLHGLADGVAEGFLGSATPGTVAAETLRFFSQGMKVAVEVAVMAMEAGLLAAGEEAISIGGTGEGADTAVVVRPAYARRIKDFRIAEILCKPRLAD